VQEPPKNNPYIQIPNPYKELNRNNSVAHHKESQTLAKLCYEVFQVNNYGKDLMKMLEEMYIYSSQVRLMSAHPAEDALYWAGYTDLIKHLRNFSNEHKKVIEGCQTSNQPQKV